MILWDSYFALISQAFYLEQTLGDISETKKDIRAHGYDSSKLQKLQ
jgi:hypothetical protein